MLLHKEKLIQQLSLSHFELVHLKTWKLGPCWSKLEFGRKVLSLSRPHKYWPLGQRSLKGHLSQVSIFLFYSSDIIASSWCILSAISHVGVGDKISVRFRFAVLHIISVSTNSNLNHHFKSYQLFSYVDLNRLHWFEAFLKARQQAHNYNGEIKLHTKSNFNLLYLREGKIFV